MGGITTAIIGSTLIGAASSAIAAKKQRKAQDAARKDAARDQEERDKQARKAEVFAETEGKGTGTLGKVRSGISLDVDDETDSEIRQGKSAKKASSLQI